MSKKVKVEFFHPQKSAEERLKEDMAMTPQQRVALGFRLADFAMEFSKERRLPSKKDNIRWRELTLKNGGTRKRI